MKRTAWFFLFISVAFGQVAPGRFIVELEGEPAAEMMAKGERRLAVAQRRSEIRRRQQAMRGPLRERRAEVLAGVDTVLNALIVRAPDGALDALARTPGVARAYRVYEMHLNLDRAIEIHKAVDAWRQIGGEARAGAGVKIGIIDSGIEIEHPGFQDADLTPPEGFPKVGRESDLAHTNKKVIVARSYEDLLGEAPEASGRDQFGHGTAVAMVAAGVRNVGPYGAITGVAPKAFLGSYKVFAGTSGRTRNDVVIKAIDDAVADGMDVINISVGSIPVPRLREDATVRAVERAAAAGVLVAVSAGNQGPDLNTVSSPANAPSVLAAGASWNDRILAATVTLGQDPPFLAFPGNGTSPAQPVIAEMVDVSKLDGDGLACRPLPVSSMEGKIALILRGECFFSEKLRRVTRAGAVAALIYTDADRPDPILMDVQGEELPAMMVSYADGVKIKQRLAQTPALSAKLQFEGAPFPVNARRVGGGSSRGPAAEGAIKPDLVAVGVEMYTATQKTTRAGRLFDPRGYTVVDGTSFSAPLVAGAAAVLKSARPGLTPVQYRALLLNSAAPFVNTEDLVQPVQHTGTGLLDVEAALRNTVTAVPTSLSFGAGGRTVDRSIPLTVTNLRDTAEHVAVTIHPSGESAAPAPSVTSLWLEPNGAGRVDIRLSGDGLAPGPHQGFIRIQGSQGEVATRIPYWYAVTSTTPQNVTILRLPTSTSLGARVSIYFQVTDAAGIRLLDTRPRMESVSGGGEVLGVTLIDDLFPGVWEAEVRLSRQEGNNVFRITAGEAVRNLTLRAGAN